MKKLKKPSPPRPSLLAALISLPMLSPLANLGMMEAAERASMPRMTPGSAPWACLSGRVSRDGVCGTDMKGMGQGICKGGGLGGA